MKIAYFCEPQVGGTFAFFQRLRPALVQHGIDMRCVSVMPKTRLTGTRYEHEEAVECVGCDVDVFNLEAMDVPTLAKCTQEIIDYLIDNQFRVIMTLAGSHVLTGNLPIYLPRSLASVIRVPMMTRGAYVPTRAVEQHVNRIIAVSDRILDDLTQRYGVDKKRVETIYHGIDLTPFTNAIPNRIDRPVEMMYAGRLWDLDKGVFLLPPIMQQVLKSHPDVRLKIAGEGSDKEELIRRFNEVGAMPSVTMLGSLSYADLCAQYIKSDIFILPSRFEGCGFAVLEAMAAGCAPVVADIRGSLRVLVDNGQAGCLAIVGDAKSFATHIEALLDNPDELLRVRVAARERVQQHYALDRMAQQYATLLRDVVQEPDARTSPRNLSEYEIPRAFKPTWRTRIPAPIKNSIRKWLERFGISS